MNRLNIFDLVEISSLPDESYLMLTALLLTSNNSHECGRYDASKVVEIVINTYVDSL